MARYSAAQTDAQLIDAASTDAAAFGALYQRHAASVHAWFARRARWAASDLTAETFAQAWLSRRRFRDRRDGSALPWLLGIARNVLRESARQNRVESSARERLGLPLDLAAEDGYESVEQRLSRPDLTDALGRLSDGERRALELRVIEGLDYGAVARALDIRPDAARLRVSRALRRLALTTEKENR